MFKRIFFTVLFICSLSSASFAGYIKFGNGISTTDGTTGNISNLDFGIYSISKFSLGVSLENGLYSDNGYYGKIIKAVDFVKTADFDNLYRDIHKIKGFGVVTNTFATLTYDIGEPRGLYIMGGIGYGIRAKLKDNVKDLAYLSSVIDKGKTPEQLMNDPIFKDAINKLAQNPSDLINLIKEIVPNSEKLISQVNTKEKIQDLLSNETALDQFINDAKDQLNSESMDKLSTIDAVCNTLVSCDYGIAYTVGIGYDLQVWGPMGIDFQAKSRFMHNSKAVHSLGANMIFKW